MKLFFVFLILLVGCASNETKTPEQEAASLEIKKILVQAAVTPGEDKRCISILSVEFCYNRVRVVYE